MDDVLDRLNKAFHYSPDYDPTLVSRSKTIGPAIAEINHLRQFRDAVLAAMRENAGNLDNPYAYIPQQEWEKIKESTWAATQ
jgi:hypothetical protein